MSNESITNVESATSAPAPATKSKKAAVKKTVKAAPVKKAPAKATKAAPVKEQKTSGLRKPQERILKALAKTGNPMTRAELSKKAPVDVAACVEYIGSHDETVRKANDVKHFPSLISLGLVRFGNNEDSPAVCYEITAKGKQVAAKLS